MKPNKYGLYSLVSTFKKICKLKNKEVTFDEFRDNVLNVIKEDNYSLCPILSDLEFNQVVSMWGVIPTKCSDTKNIYETFIDCYVARDELNLILKNYKKELDILFDKNKKANKFAEEFEAYLQQIEEEENKKNKSKVEANKDDTLVEDFINEINEFAKEINPHYKKQQEEEKSIFVNEPKEKSNKDELIPIYALNRIYSFLKNICKEQVSIHDLSSKAAFYAKENKCKNIYFDISKVFNTKAIYDSNTIFSSKTKFNSSGESFTDFLLTKKQIQDIFGNNYLFNKVDKFIKSCNGSYADIKLKENKAEYLYPIVGMFLYLKDKYPNEYYLKDFEYKSCEYFHANGFNIRHVNPDQKPQKDQYGIKEVPTGLIDFLGEEAGFNYYLSKSQIVDILGSETLHRLEPYFYAYDVDTPLNRAIRNVKKIMQEDLIQKNDDLILDFLKRYANLNEIHVDEIDVDKLMGNLYRLIK